MPQPELLRAATLGITVQGVDDLMPPSGKDFLDSLAMMGSNLRVGRGNIIFTKQLHHKEAVHLASLMIDVGCSG